MTKIEEEALSLSKAVLALENHGYIDATGADEQEELHCEHLRRIAIYHAKKIRDLSMKVETK